MGDSCLGNGLVPVAAGVGICIILEPCGASVGTVVAIGAAAVGIASAAYLGYQYFAKGGPQNIVPSWAEGERPLPGETAADFAKRLCDQRYGPGNYNRGPASEYSKIKKWASRKFGI